MPDPLDLAEFRLLRALKSGHGGAAFLQLWNAQAGATWSVFRALVDRDVEAVGWMASFRLDLHERAGRLRPDQPLGPQVGEALYAHALPSFAARGALPAGPLSPDEAGVRALPPSTRLAYLVDLFFDWTPPDPRLPQAYRLLEPAADTDARLLVHTALMRTAPAEVLLFPPGDGPAPAASVPRRGSRFRLFALLVGLLLGVVGVTAWMVRPPPALRAHQRAASRAPGLPPVACGPALDGLVLALRDCPDLEAVDLQRVGVGVDDGAAVFVYQNDDVTFSLQHRLGGLPGVPERQPTRPTRVGEVCWVSWREGATTWTLTARAAPDRVLGTSMAILSLPSPPR
jgi:hypothetical protein